MTAALSRLLPNLGGPGGRVRRLYTNTVNSVALYGAPVWADVAMRSRRIKLLMRRAHRIVALRAARAYRTVGYAAATVLAGVLPLELMGQTHAEMYRRVKVFRERGAQLTTGARAVIRRQARHSLVIRWQRYLSEPRAREQRAVGAILLLLPEWLGREWGAVTFRVA